jgi:hypothetical protein
MAEDLRHQSSLEHVWKTQDPELGNPDRKGMLLSDQIDKFCKAKLLIAENYAPDRLRPAAYTLTIGDDYVNSSGRKKKLTLEKPSYEMPPTLPPVLICALIGCTRVYCWVLGLKSNPGSEVIYPARFIT